MVEAWKFIFTSFGAAALGKLCCNWMHLGNSALAIQAYVPLVDAR
jgi:hypothetical protein